MKTIFPTTDHCPATDTRPLEELTDVELAQAIREGRPGAMTAEDAREAEAAAREVEQVRGQWAAHEEAMRRHHGADHVSVEIARKNAEQAVELTRRRRELEHSIKRATADNDHAQVERLRAELTGMPVRPMPPAQPSSRKHHT